MPKSDSAKDPKKISAAAGEVDKTLALAQKHLDELVKLAADIKKNPENAEKFTNEFTKAQDNLNNKIRAAHKAAEDMMKYIGS